jgi:DNA-binding transcriptional ArsR family regulator
MPDVNGADPGIDLSNAYRALARRREEADLERERLTSQIAKLDAALEVLRDLVGESPAGAVTAAVTAAAGPELAGTEGSTAEAAGVPVRPRHSAKAVDRRVRVIELLLENPQQWFSSSEVARITERPNPTSAQRNAVSEALRRLLQHGNVERDESSKPVRYRAIPSALRELLLRG